jgi:hypothetical protein
VLCKNSDESTAQLARAMGLLSEHDLPRLFFVDARSEEIR